ncbi:MAG: sigma-54-dependent Fis family transcriptional regulator [Planctomycetes bacterium]|nr:sigma-54-dependent Fis family transcriptional regulator [Planctomycetota bacterium]
MSRPIRVLVVDDEPFVRESLVEVLLAEGLEVATAKNVREARSQLKKRAFDVIVSDVRMPGESGIQLIDEAQARLPPTPIVLVTGVGTVGEAVAAMKKGAFDFVQKPIDPDALVLLVRRAAEHRALLAEVQSLRGARADEADSRIVGDSAAMERVRTLIAQVAPGDTPVLVQGESGTGKELVARAVHAAGPRARGPFVRLVCAGVTEEEFEAQLCGTRRSRGGRLEEAEGGTLVLDLIGNLSAANQARLFAVLESGEYRRPGEAEPRVIDARLVTLATVDLAQHVKAGTFRADLYYRLAAFPILIAPLREHKEDIAAISAAWLASRGADPLAVGAALSPAVLDVLASYDWPGNVRELENVLERAAIVSGASAPTPEVLRTILESGGQSQAAPDLFEFNIRSNLDAREKELLLGALERAKGKKRDASDLLGIDARNLGYYLRKHHIKD